MAKRLNTILNHLGQDNDISMKVKLNDKNLKDPIEFLNLEELIPTALNISRKKLREMLEREIAPIIPEYIEKAKFPKEILQHLKPLFGLSEENYGCRKLSSSEKSLNLYELARIDGSIATFYLVITLVIFTIERLGSEEQKTLYLPGLCRLDIIGCWGLTEPDYGSDASSLKTTATPVDDGFLLNGTKTWIGNAIISDIMIIWARNTITKQVEGFIVPTQSKGVSIKNIERKLAMRMVQNGEIKLNNVKVPLNSRLEKATTFNNGANIGLEHSRMTLSWIATGIMSGVYEASLKHLRERIQFQVPIGLFQINQEKLVRILGHYQASFLLSWRITQLHEQNQAKLEQASLIKAWTSLIAREAVRLGRELIGGNGIIIDNYVMKALADIEAIYTYEGTYDINALVVGRAITDYSAFKSKLVN